MGWKLRLVVAGTLAYADCSAAYAQTFDFTAEQFRARFDRQLKADNADTIRACNTQGPTTTCTFNDAKFQGSVQAFKMLDIVNGDFALSEELIIQTAGGKVQWVLLGGDRSTPMGTFHFIGQLGSLMMMLNPGMAPEATIPLAKRLGLMRGDDDRTIGEPQVAIEKFAAIECNSQHSQVSSAIGCKFMPRY